MMKKKIIRVTTISGSLNTLLKGQLKFLSDNYEVVGVASDAGTGKLAEVEKRENIRCIDVKMHREISLWNDVASLIALVRLFRKERPYIVHANTPKGSLLSMIAAWFTRVPHRIYTVTGLRFETTTGLFRWILVTMERITCRCATKVIPEGQGVRNTLIANKITNKPLEVVLNGNINGIDVGHYAITSDVLEDARPYVKQHVFTFVFVGRIVKDKGINELVRAFVRLYATSPDIRLLLVGNFEEVLDPETKDLIDAYDAIECVGYQKDVRPFFAASDVLAFPSYREGFPNVVLQAGAMGLPSVVTDINGCNEIVVEGKNGVIIPKQNEDALYEAMKWMYEHKDSEVRKMAENARPMVADRYEQSKVWEAMLGMYQAL